MRACEINCRVQPIFVAQRGRTRQHGVKETSGSPLDGPDIGITYNHTEHVGYLAFVNWPGTESLEAMECSGESKFEWQEASLTALELALFVYHWNWYILM